MSSPFRLTRNISVVTAILLVMGAVPAQPCHAQFKTIKKMATRSAMATRSFAKGMANRTGLRTPRDRPAPQTPPDSAASSRRSTGPQRPSPSNSSRSSGSDYSRRSSNSIIYGGIPNMQGAQPKLSPRAQHAQLTPQIPALSGGNQAGQQRQAGQPGKKPAGQFQVAGNLVAVRSNVAPVYAQHFRQPPAPTTAAARYGQTRQPPRQYAATNNTTATQSARAFGISPPSPRR